MKEWDFEAKFKDPVFWASPHVSKGLLFDQGKLAMLAYLNMACDAVSLHVEECMQSLLKLFDGSLEVSDFRRSLLYLFRKNWVMSNLLAGDAVALLMNASFSCVVSCDCIRFII